MMRYIIFSFYIALLYLYRYPFSYASNIPEEIQLLNPVSTQAKVVVVENKSFKNRNDFNHVKWDANDDESDSSTVRPRDMDNIFMDYSMVNPEQERELAFNVAKCEGLLTKLIKSEPSLAFLNIQCNTVASLINKVGSSIVKTMIPDSITDSTVLAIKDVINTLLAVIARLADLVTGDNNMCFGDFDGSLFNEDLLNPNSARTFNQGALDTDGCSIIPLPNTLTDTFTVFSYSIPHFLVDPICPDPLGGALTMCFMMSFCIDGVPVPETFGFTVNNEVLACLAGNNALAAATLGISKVVGEIAGMTGFTIGTGISVNGGFAQSIYVYDGSSLKLATVRGNFFEALTIDASSILPEKLQKYFSLEGKQRSTFGVFGDLDAFRRDIPAVIKKEQKFQTLLDNFYFEIANHMEGSMSLLLADLTNGFLSDFGPINLGGANVLLTTNPNGSGQVKQGFYTYIYGSNLAVELVKAFIQYISDFFGAALSAMREMLGDMDPLVAFQKAVDDATDKLTQKLSAGLDPDNVPKLAIWLTGFDDRAFSSDSNVEFGIRFDISPAAAIPFYQDIMNGLAKGVDAVSSATNGARDVVAKYLDSRKCDSSALRNFPLPDASRMVENLKGIGKIGLQLTVKAAKANFKLILKNPFEGVFDTKVFDEAGKKVVNSFVNGFCQGSEVCNKNMKFDASLLTGNLRFSPVSLALSVARGIQSVVNSFFPNCGIIKAIQSVRELKKFLLSAIDALVADVKGFWECINGGGTQDYYCLTIGTKNVVEKAKECEPDEWFNDKVCKKSWGPFNFLKVTCKVIRKVIKGACKIVEKVVGVIPNEICVRRCSITHVFDFLLCQAASCIPTLGSSNTQQNGQRICTTTDKCYKGEGTCTNDGQCQSRLKCDRWSTQKCIGEGHPSYCVGTPCDIGQGKCWSNKTCKPGLKCGRSQKCIGVGHVDYCSYSDKCNEGEGVCKADYECNTNFCYKGLCRRVDENLCSTYGCQDGYRCRTRCVAPSECFRPSCAYCTETEKCDEGIGECTNSNQCIGNLRCRDGRCRSPSYPGYCSSEERCGLNQGSCIWSGHCKSGLLCEDGVCKQSVKDEYCESNLCLTAFGLRCRNSKCVNESDDFCSTSEKCSNGQGKCDSDDECQSGLKCTPALASDLAGYSRCRAPNTVGYCHVNSKCVPGVGYCENNNQCTSGVCTNGICLATIGGDCSAIAPCSNSHCDFGSGKCVGPGSTGYCSTTYQCDIGEGACVATDQCNDGRCIPSKNSNYYLCSSEGSEGYCSSARSEKCSFGLGKCETNNDCDDGLVCDARKKCMYAEGNNACRHNLDCASDTNGTFSLHCYVALVGDGAGTCVSALSNNYCTNNLCEYGEGPCSSHNQCAPDLICSNSVCKKPSCDTTCSRDGSKICDPVLHTCVSAIGGKCESSNDCAGTLSRCILGICRDVNDTLYCRDETCSQGQGECKPENLRSPLSHLISIDTLMSNLAGSYVIQAGTNDVSKVGAFALGGPLDLNGDGIDDLAFTFTDASLGDTAKNRAFVLFGKTTRPSSTVSINIGAEDSIDGLNIYGNAVSTGVSYDITSAVSIGDIDGDGLDDLAVAAYGKQSVWIIFGKNTVQQPKTLNTRELYNNYYASENVDYRGVYFVFLDDLPNGIGYSISPIGDFNGDGYGDFIIGSQGVSPWDVDWSMIIFGRDRSQIQIVSPYGFFSYKNVDYNAALAGGFDGNRTFLGQHVSSAGDWNNDGYDDVIISSSSKGNYLFHFGHANNINQEKSNYIPYGNDMVLLQDSAVPDTAVSFSGYAGTGVGDVNGDGVDDVVVGNGRSGSSNQGAIFILLGNIYGAQWKSPVDLRNPPAAYKSFIIPIFGDSNNGEFGSDIAVIDVNGDGIDDIVVGAPGIDKVYVIFGRLSFTLNTTSADAASDVVIQGAAGSRFGDAIGHGDYNGDRIQDLSISASNFDGGKGKIYIIPGLITERNNGTFAGCDNGLICRTIKTSLADKGITRCLPPKHDSYCSSFVKCNLGEGYCKSNSDCNSGSVCDSTSKVCVATVGSTCIKDDDTTCEGSARCINNICRASPFAGFCSNGEILDSRKCSSLQGECESSLQCANGLKCQLVSTVANYKRCIAKDTVGYCSVAEPCPVGYGKCSIDDHCSLGLICDTATNVCKSKLGDRTGGCGKEDPNNSTNFLPDDTLCVQQGTKCDAGTLVCVITSIGQTGCVTDSDCPTGSWCSSSDEDLSGRFSFDSKTFDSLPASYCVREGTKYVGPGVCSGSESVLILGTGKSTWSQSLSIKQCEDRCYADANCREFAANTVTGACELYVADACGENGRSNLYVPNPKMSKYINIAGSNPNGKYFVFRRFCTASNPCSPQTSSGRRLSSSSPLRCLDNTGCVGPNVVCGFPRPADARSGGFCGLTLGSVCSTDSDCAAPNRCLGGTCKAVVVVDVGRSVIKIGFDPVSNDVPVRLLTTEIFIGTVQINTTEFNNQTGRYENTSEIVDVTAVGDDIARYEGRGAILSGSIETPLLDSYFDPTQAINWDMVMRIIKASALGSDLNNTALMLTGAIFGYGLPRTCVPGYNYTDIQDRTLATDFADVVDAAMNAFNISHMQFIDAGASAFVGLTGLTTGLFVDVSDYQINVIPVVNGKVYCGSSLQLYLGGIKVDECLRDKLKDLSQNNAYFASFYDDGGDIPTTVVRQVKHRAGQVATTAAEYIKMTTGVNETSAKTIRSLALDDGQTVYYRDLDILTCTEELFQQHHIVELTAEILDYLKYIPDDVSNFIETTGVTITGGITILPGFISRFNNEWFNVTGRFLEINAPNQRSFAAYLGGAIAAQNIPESKWITRVSWLTNGAKMVIENNEINSTSVYNNLEGPVTLINASEVVTPYPTRNPTIAPTVQPTRPPSRPGDTAQPSTRPTLFPTESPTKQGANSSVSIKSINPFNQLALLVLLAAFLHN